MERRLERRRGLPVATLAVLAGALLTAGVDGAGAAKSALKGRISADGSSTVGPYVMSAAGGFRTRFPGVRITVGISGTGGGFERFCRGETDLSNASRPMKASEASVCAANGVKWVSFTVANDGITVVVNRANTWATCLTVPELRKMWDAGSKVDNWHDVRASFPNVPLRLFGPGTDSGTFDFFTEKINGKARRSRPDYQASEDDNVTVRGVTSERGGLGYFGLSYFEENQSRLRAVKIDDGAGCVAPSAKTVQANRYKPLSRPLFVYAKRDSFKRREVSTFLGYIFDNERAIARKARFVSLTKKQLRKARYHYKLTVRAVRR